MKKIYSIFSALLVACTLNAQTTITHSTSQAIVAGSIACGGTGTSQNSYFRAFLLSGFGINTDWEISEVEFGIEEALPFATEQFTITVNLYENNSGTPFPGGTATLIGSEEITIGALTSTLLQVPFTSTTIAAGSELIVEINSPDQQSPAGQGGSIYIASNAGGQTAPGYLSAAACGITVPTDIATLGFPNMHIIMNVTGAEPAGCETFSSITETSCGDYTAPDGSIVSESGIFDVVIPNAADCDSTITIDLTVVTLDNTISESGFTLSANQDGATYQWVDCDNGNAIIEDETSQDFTATMPGTYACEITLDGCSDMSNCVYVDVESIDENLLDAIEIYPNPAKSIVVISNIPSNTKLTISNALGQEVMKVTPKTANHQLDVSTLLNGIYFIKAEALNGTSTLQKLVVNK